jgi:hypothetical protein
MIESRASPTGLLVTAAGATYRLLGVNRSSAEFACVQGRASSTRRSLTRPRSTP